MPFDLASIYTVTRQARRIIVVDLGFLGDSVHLTPALWEIKRSYPQAQLHTLSATVGAQVLSLVPCVDRARAFPLTPDSPPWWRHWDILTALRRERYDLAFNFSGRDRSIFITAFLGAKWSVAAVGGRDHFWKTWLIPHWVPRRDRGLPVFEQRRQALAACGLKLGPVQFGLKVSPEAYQWAVANTPSKSVHLAINASSHLKEWPLDHWAQLSNLLLRDPDLHLLATGSQRSREQERLARLSQAVNHPRLRVIREEITIPQLTAMLSRCRAHVGGDSGVLHLAMAQGIPTVSIFRQYAGLPEWLPLGPAHRHLSAPCGCVNQKDQPCKALDHAQCLAQINPGDVAQAVMETLAEPASPRPA